MEVHQTVRLLKEKRNFSSGPLHQVVRDSNGCYKWTLKHNTDLPIYEQSLSANEKKLLERWKVEAQIWGADSTFRLRKSHDSYDYHNWRDDWDGITENPAWGFEESGKFDESLVKVVYDNAQVTD